MKHKNDQAILHLIQDKRDIYWPAEDVVVYNEIYYGKNDSFLKLSVICWVGESKVMKPLINIKYYLCKHKIIANWNNADFIKYNKIFITRIVYYH